MDCHVCDIELLSPKDGKNKILANRYQPADILLDSICLFVTRKLPGHKWSGSLFHHVNGHYDSSAKPFGGGTMLVVGFWSLSKSLQTEHVIKILLVISGCGWMRFRLTQDSSQHDWFLGYNHWA